MSEPPRVVVGAAIVRNGRLLGARRMSPAGAVGRWELPGGKVRRGEDLAAAAVREVREELSCEVSVTGLIAGQQPVRPGLVLRVALARLTAGEPIPSEHDVIRWLGPDQLADVPWLEPDLPFVPSLREALRKTPPT